MGDDDETHLHAMYASHLDMDEALKIWPADKMVGNVRNNGPQLVLPVLSKEEVPA